MRAADHGRTLATMGARTSLWPLAMVAATAAACGGASGGGPADAPAIDAVPVDAPPPGEPWFDEGLRRGRIELVELVEQAGPVGGAALAHAVFAPQPTAMRFVFYARVAVRHWQQETQRAGSCRLLVHQPVFCSACAGICVAPEVCEPYPDYASAGALTWDGLRGPPLTLQPNPYFYASQGAQLPVDAVADDATVTVTATGDQVPAFVVAAGAVAPLALPVAPITDDTLRLDGGADVTLRWTPVDPLDPTLRVRVAINANNMGHGNPYAAVIECDAADVGALTIPAAMIDAFPPTARLEVCEGSDCPRSTITRYRRGAVEVGGAPVDLVVGSRLEFFVVRP